MCYVYSWRLASYTYSSVTKPAYIRFMKKEVKNKCQIGVKVY